MHQHGTLMLFVRVTVSFLKLTSLSSLSTCLPLSHQAADHQSGDASSDGDEGGGGGGCEDTEVTGGQDHQDG